MSEDQIVRNLRRTAWERETKMREDKYSLDQFKEAMYEAEQYGDNVSDFKKRVLAQLTRPKIEFSELEVVHVNDGDGGYYRGHLSTTAACFQKPERPLTINEMSQPMRDLYHGAKRFSGSLTVADAVKAFEQHHGVNDE